MIKQWQFNSVANARIVRTVKSGKAIRYIDTHDTDTLLSFTPTDNQFSYERQLVIDKYNVSDNAANLAIKTPATGRLGITASTGHEENQVIVKWIRARKAYPKELVHLKKEDVSVLVKNINSDWYVIDTTVTTVKNGSAANINTAINDNQNNNHDSVFIEKWKDFPSSDLVRNGCYSFGRHINYRN